MTYTLPWIFGFGFFVGLWVLSLNYYHKQKELELLILQEKIEELDLELGLMRDREAFDKTN